MLPPRSTDEPSDKLCVQTLPPTRSRASRTAIDLPLWLSFLAAVSPANPAPTTQTSASIVSGIGVERYSAGAIRVGTTGGPDPYAKCIVFG